MSNELPKSPNPKEFIINGSKLPDGPFTNLTSVKFLIESILPVDIPIDLEWSQSEDILVIKIHDNIIGKVGEKFKDLYTEIEESKYILKLEESWDDEGAKKISETVFTNAVKFLIDYSEFIYNIYGLNLSTPEINPCVDGSIDLSFRNEYARLLINIQNDEHSNAIYYGDLYDNKLSIKGTVPIDGVYEHLAIWMKQLA